MRIFFFLQKDTRYYYLDLTLFFGRSCLEPHERHFASLAFTFA